MVVLKFWRLEIIIDVKAEELEPCKGKIISTWSYRKMKNVKFFVHQDDKGNVKIRKME
ncbi:MAG: hypothetical protein MPF33_07985 [Candidatus Aramenus sp.]|jgi:hypothetical protein|nr:hypothetical protein [Candidatus Aramenus sp.]